MARYDEIEELEPGLDGAGLRIGIAMSRFNIDVGEGLLSGAVDELKRLGVCDDDVLITSVPGALELPLTLQVMAQGADQLVRRCAFRAAPHEGLGCFFCQKLQPATP